MGRPPTPPALTEAPSLSGRLVWASGGSQAALAATSIWNEAARREAKPILFGGILHRSTSPSQPTAYSPSFQMLREAVHSKNLP